MLGKHSGNRNSKKVSRVNHEMPRRALAPRCIWTGIWCVATPAYGALIPRFDAGNGTYLSPMAEWVTWTCLRFGLRMGSLGSWIFNFTAGDFEQPSANWPSNPEFGVFHANITPWRHFDDFADRNRPYATFRSKHGLRQHP